MIDVLVPVEQEGTKAVVRTWLKQVGQRVEENEPLVELETDKVAMEVPAPASGVLREIVLNTDADAAPGAVLGRISTEAEADAPPLAGEDGQDRVAPRPEALSGGHGDLLIPVPGRIGQRTSPSP